MLYLSGTQVSDVTLLAGLAGLTTLDLWATPVSDLTPLAGLVNLEHYYDPRIPGHPRFAPE